MTAVKWPGSAYDPAADDLSAPIKQLLKDLNLLEGNGAVSLTRGTPQSLQVITAGGTALSKGWATFVGLFGGGGALWTAIQGFGASPEDDALQRAVFVAAAAVILAAAVTAIAVIVKADVQARAEASAAEYEARAHVVNALLSNLQYGRPTAAPVRYWLRRKDKQNRSESKWHSVVDFEWDDKTDELVAVTGSGQRVPWLKIAEWTTAAS